ncbi:Protein Brevis radix-like 1 [Abeliophyllum distichum]|uniref:Protein Brevis radix-like 1 n=1 Tax=Abeliophyllum distichum TaxID=126358 RepID=A0ABD1VXT6_9LAMI
MSRNYDNWEKLVGAVLRREQDRDLARADSRSTSFSSNSISLDFEELSLSFRREVTNVKIGGRSSRSESVPSVLISDSFESSDNNSSSKGLDGNGLKSRNSVISINASQNEVEWIEQYEADVHVTVVAFQDGSRDIKQAHFSNRRFTEHQAETWWSKNREKVYKKYSIRRTRGIFGVPASNKAASRNERVVSQVNNAKDSGNGSRSRNTVDSNKVDTNQKEVELVEQFGPGVYITLVARQDGTRDIIRVRFSRKRFQKHQAMTWWSKNWEKVYGIFNIGGVDVLK